MSIDESYKAFKRDDLKAVYSIKMYNQDKLKKEEQYQNIKIWQK